MKSTFHLKHTSISAILGSTWSVQYKCRYKANIKLPSVNYDHSFTLLLYYSSLIVCLFVYSVGDLIIKGGRIGIPLTGYVRIFKEIVLIYSKRQNLREILINKKMFSDK